MAGGFEEEVGIKALQFIAGSREMIDAFVDVSGLDISDLRHASAQPGFFESILDFILADDARVMAFAEAIEIDPMKISHVRQKMNAS